MRTTLNIDDDVLGAVQENARRERKPVGKVVSELLRAALTRSPNSPGQGEIREEDAFYGFQPFTPRETLITNDLIDKLRDWEGC